MTHSLPLVYRTRDPRAPNARCTVTLIPTSKILVSWREVAWLQKQLKFPSMPKKHGRIGSSVVFGSQALGELYNSTEGGQRPPCNSSCCLSPQIQKKVSFLMWLSLVTAILSHIVVAIWREATSVHIWICSLSWGARRDAQTEETNQVIIKEHLKCCSEKYLEETWKADEEVQ